MRDQSIVIGTNIGTTTNRLRYNGKQQVTDTSEK